jgi:hypothetical protein
MHAHFDQLLQHLAAIVGTRWLSAGRREGDR